MRLKFLEFGTLKIAPCALAALVVASVKDDDDTPIGSKVWMTDNLRPTKCNEGTPITYSNSNDDLMNLMVGVMSYYHIYAVNMSTYGALYNWQLWDLVSSDRMVEIFYSCGCVKD